MQAAPVERGLRNFWWVLALLLVLGVAGAFAAKPAYRWFKTERARKLVSEAVPALEAGQWDQVRSKVEVAVGLAPFDPRVRWLMARYYSAGGLAEALAVWKALPAADLSREDRVIWAQLALKHDRLDLAARLVTALLSEFPDDPMVLRLAMLTADQHRDSGQALGYARNWIAREPDSPEARWHLGQRALNADDDGVRAEGRRLLLKLAMNPGPFEKLAGALLSDRPELSLDEREALLRRLVDGGAPLLVIASAEFHLEPGRQAGAIGKVIAAAQAETNRPAMSAQIAWLEEHGAGAQLLDVLSADKVADQPGLRGARVQALLEAGRPAEAREEMSRMNPGDHELQLRCFEGWLAHAANDDSNADSYLSGAVASAKGSAGALRFVAEYALRLGRDRPAIQAYEQMLRTPAGLIDAGRSLVSLSMKVDDLTVLLRAMEALRDRLPGDPQVRSLLAYLRFLLGKGGVRDDLDWLVGQAAKPNANPLITAGRALGRWRLGEAGQGLDEVEALDPDELKRDPRLQMVHVILLAANQQSGAARRIGQALPREKLHRDERRILAEAVP